MDFNDLLVQFKETNAELVRTLIAAKNTTEETSAEIYSTVENLSKRSAFQAFQVVEFLSSIKGTASFEASFDHEIEIEKNEGSYDSPVDGR